MLLLVERVVVTVSIITGRCGSVDGVSHELVAFASGPRVGVTGVSSTAGIATSWLLSVGMLFTPPWTLSFMELMELPTDASEAVFEISENCAGSVETHMRLTTNVKQIATIKEALILASGGFWRICSSMFQNEFIYSALLFLD